MFDKSTNSLIIHVTKAYIYIYNIKRIHTNIFLYSIEITSCTKSQLYMGKCSTKYCLKNNKQKHAVKVIRQDVE